MKTTYANVVIGYKLVLSPEILQLTRNLEYSNDFYFCSDRSIDDGEFVVFGVISGGVEGCGVTELEEPRCSLEELHSFLLTRAASMGLKLPSSRPKPYITVYSD